MCLKAKKDAVLVSLVACWFAKVTTVWFLLPDKLTDTTIWKIKHHIYQKQNNNPGHCIYISYNRCSYSKHTLYISFRLCMKYYQSESSLVYCTADARCRMCRLCHVLHTLCSDEQTMWLHSGFQWLVLTLPPSTTVTDALSTHKYSAWTWKGML